MANRTTIAPDKSAKDAKKSPSPNGAGHAERERIFYLFRRWGFYEATLDPLGFLAPPKGPHRESAPPRPPGCVPPQKCPAPEGLPGKYAEEARRIYCGTIGVEFLHIPELDRRRWIAERREGPELKDNQGKIFERLVG